MKQKTSALLIAAFLVLTAPDSGLLGIPDGGSAHLWAAEADPSTSSPQSARGIPSQAATAGPRDQRQAPMAGMPGMRGQAPANAGRQPQQAPPQPIAAGMTGIPGAGGMGTADQGLTMREVLYIMSLQDAMQVIADLLAVQERLIDPKPPEKESLRREMVRIKERTRKISDDYREVLSGRLRGE